MKVVLFHLFIVFTFILGACGGGVGSPNEDLNHSSESSIGADNGTEGAGAQEIEPTGGEGETSGNTQVGENSEAGTHHENSGSGDDVSVSGSDSESDDESVLIYNGESAVFNAGSAWGGDGSSMQESSGAAILEPIIFARLSMPAIGGALRPTYRPHGHQWIGAKASA